MVDIGEECDCSRAEGGCECSLTDSDHCGQLLEVNSLKTGCPADRGRSETGHGDLRPVQELSVQEGPTGPETHRGPPRKTAPRYLLLSPLL